MKLTAFKIFIIASVLASCSSSGKITTTWKNPSFVPANPGKLLVYVKITEPNIRTEVEDLIVKNFQQQGIDAIAAHSNISENDLKNIDSFRKKAHSQNVTSLITFKPLKKASEVKSTRQMAVGTGISGNYGGFYYGLLSTPIPISGTGTLEEHFIVETNYYTQASESAEWLASVNVNTNKNLEETAAKLTKLIIDKMKKQGIL